MNWGKYLANQLELYCCEAQDQGYEFHFSWLLILIAFIAWEMSEGVTLPHIELFEPLVVSPKKARAIDLRRTSVNGYSISKHGHCRESRS
jgi:hypothetical protein